MKTKQGLGFCPNCKEPSVAVSIYKNKQGGKSRYEFCINRGCTHKLDTTIKEAS